jgi:hypothetical protein
MSNHKHNVDPIVYAHTTYLNGKNMDNVPPVFRIKKTYMMPGQKTVMMKYFCESTTITVKD